jgi:hypothetical protein
MTNNRDGTTRRGFLKQGGLAAASVIVAGALPAGEELALLAGPQFDNVVHLIRPEDQLVLRVASPSMSGLAGANVEVFVQNGGYFLRPKAGLAEALLRVEMGPQHTMEWATSPVARPSQPVHSLPTELLYRLPAGQSVPLTLDGLLTAFRELELVAHPIAGTVGQAAAAGLIPAAELLRSAMARVLDPAAPASDALRRDASMRGRGSIGLAVQQIVASDDATIPSAASMRLLISSRLILTAPGGHTRFSHAIGPVRHGKPHTEIWHTRLTVLDEEGGRVQLPVDARAIFALEGSGTGGWLSDVDDSKLIALSAVNAKAVVSQNAVIDSPDPGASALRMSRLQLSPRLGASTRLQGNWSQQAGATVKSFSHTTSTGRDVFSRTAVTGKLYPLGHKAVQTETVERVFRYLSGGQLAHLRKRTKVTVLQPVKSDYTNRTWPFTSIEVLDDSPPPGEVHLLSGAAGYLTVDGLPYQYDCRGIDHAGNPVDFTMPLVFVPDTFTNYSGLATAWASTINDSNPVRRLPKVYLGRVAVAEPGDVPGATEVTGEAKFTVSASSDFVPSVQEFTGRIPALGQLADQGQAMVVKYADAFKAVGFGDGNAGEVVLALQNALPVGLTSAVAAGGLFSPLSMSITGLSRKIGTVAGPLADIAAGDFKPEQFLGSALFSQLNLFGVFPLGQLIEAASDLSRAPKLAAATVDGLRTQTFVWEAPLFKKQQELGFGGAKLRPLPNGDPKLRIESVLTVGPDGQPSQRTVCRVTDVLFAFGLGSGELIRLPLPVIEVTSVDTQKPKVDVDLGDLEFLGVLAFVSRLASLIDKAGFAGQRAIGQRATTGNGPSIDVTPNGVRASYGLAIPSVAVGMFSLENITFGSSLSLPFDGSPALEFTFATPDNPFRLTVSMLGGGGHLALGVSAHKGLDYLQGALEFGAQLRIDLKVIEGKVEAMGGIYFKIENGSTTLTGYLRISGEVSVLSLITAGVRATLLLTYQDKKVRGEAELVFYVSTFFFSTSVRRNFKRKFAGSNGDPTLAQLMAPAGFTGPRPWDTYCQAYA